MTEQSGIGRIALVRGIASIKLLHKVHHGLTPAMMHVHRPGGFRGGWILTCRDMVVIGSGEAGKHLTRILAQAGPRMANGFKMGGSSRGRALLAFRCKGWQAGIRRKAECRPKRDLKKRLKLFAQIPEGDRRLLVSLAARWLNGTSSVGEGEKCRQVPLRDAHRSRGATRSRSECRTHGRPIGALRVRRRQTTYPTGKFFRRHSV